MAGRDRLLTLESPGDGTLLSWSVEEDRLEALIGALDSAALGAGAVSCIEIGADPTAPTRSEVERAALDLRRSLTDATE